MEKRLKKIYKALRLACLKYFGSGGNCYFLNKAKRKSNEISPGVKKKNLVDFFPLEDINFVCLL